MFRKHTDSCPTKIDPCYPQTLKQAISQYLPCRLFTANEGVRWCQRYVAICALMMVWSANDVLIDRFNHARRSLTEMFLGRKRPGTTYQGFIAALLKVSDTLLASISAHLREQVQEMAGKQWECLGFVPIGADGSKVECPMTAANEQAFGCAGKKKSTPQQFVTTLLHLPTGVVWEFKTGPACSSEREHLRQMLPTLPKKALVIADAGFTGYDLLTAIRAGGHDFLIRVGANVHLLLKLGYALEERDGIVYLWPEGMQKKNRPPLVLRLITLCDARNRRMNLLTNVLDEARMSPAAACTFYTMRWGVELYYRALKQTLARRKLASDAPHNARMELSWAMIGLWLLCMMTAGAITRAGEDVRRLSVAGALRRIRMAMRAPTARKRFGQQLAGAVKDRYMRTSSKRARHWPHKKKPEPIGDPAARFADESEVQAALKLRNEPVAAFSRYPDLRKQAPGDDFLAYFGIIPVFFLTPTRAGGKGRISDRERRRLSLFAECPRRRGRSGDNMSKPRYFIPQPQRVRQITHSFAWIDHRLLRRGFVQVMTHQDQSLYLFLNLVADRNGVSFYRKEKICDLLDLHFGQFEIARDRLIHLGLLAFAPYSALTVNGFHQVLPVDGGPIDFATARPKVPETDRLPDAATDPRHAGPAALCLAARAPAASAPPVAVPPAPAPPVAAPPVAAPPAPAPMAASERAAKRAARDRAAELAAMKLAAAFKAGLSKA